MPFLRPLLRLSLALLGLAALRTTSAAVELQVSAAASLAEVLGELGPVFARTAGHGVRLNYGGSGMLARQIEAGAPADVFLPADEAQLDRLARGGLLLAGSRRTLCRNQLVVIVAAHVKPVPASLADLTAPALRRLALGDPALVPAGAYAQAWLEDQKLWHLLKPRLIPLSQVRAVLAAVAAGNADAGWVYRSDVPAGSAVRIAFSLPPGNPPRIAYGAAALARTTRAREAMAWLDFLASAPAQAAFRRHGFLLPAEVAPAPQP